MPTTHRVELGQDLAHIAAHYGFHAIEPIYEANRALLNRQGGLLYDGNEIEIPDRQPLVRQVQTHRRHVFVRKTLRIPLRLQLLGEGDEPYDATPYELELLDGLKQGTKLQGTTDAQGVIDERIPLAKRVMVRYLDADDEVVEHEVFLTSLAPFDSDKGIRERLQNAGFEMPPQDVHADDWTQAAKDALLRFVQTYDDGVQTADEIAVPNDWRQQVGQRLLELCKL